MVGFLTTHWATIIDVAAKVATVVASIGIWVAFCQYRHSVSLAKTDERRKAVELAAKECLRFGEKVIPDLDSLRQQLEQIGFQYSKRFKAVYTAAEKRENLRLEPPMTTEDREKVKEHLPRILCVLNSLEGFAIPFNTGVADNEVGLMECGRAFVRIFEENLALYCLANLEHYYKSSQSLYFRWRKQIHEQELEQQHSKAGKEFFVLTAELVKRKSGSRFALMISEWFRKLGQ